MKNPPQPFELCCSQTKKRTDKQANKQTSVKTLSITGDRNKDLANVKCMLFLATHAKATPVATATALPPELPPVMNQSETSLSTSAAACSPS